MKLIDLLVKELPHRGGWPKGVDAVEQDCEGELFEKYSDYCSGFKLEKCDDWITDVVTKQQYESALAASKSVVGHDGWIQWAGGECPVDGDAIVEVKFRNPSQYQFNNDRAVDFNWSHDGFGGDIIAYRLRKPTKSEQVRDDAAENDDEADLNECIGQDVDTTEWNGEGLPPVGIKCEHCPGGTTQHEWEIVTVAGVHENTSTGFTDYWLVRENGSSYIVGNPYRFRPLRTEEEKLRDEVGLALYHAINWNEEGEMVGQSRMEDYKKAYDAIAAGKIPGVKLEEK